MHMIMFVYMYICIYVYNIYRFVNQIHISGGFPAICFATSPDGPRQGAGHVDPLCLRSVHEDVQLGRENLPRDVGKTMGIHGN